MICMYEYYLNLLEDRKIDNNNTLISEKFTVYCTVSPLFHLPDTEAGNIYAYWVILKWIQVTNQEEWTTP